MKSFDKRNFDNLFRLSNTNSSSSVKLPASTLCFGFIISTDNVDVVETGFNLKLISLTGRAGDDFREFVCKDSPIVGPDSCVCFDDVTVESVVGC